MNTLTALRRRALTVVALVLLVAGPLAAATLHDEHEGHPCPVCRLGHKPTFDLTAVPAVTTAVLRPETEAAVPTAMLPLADGFHRASPPRGPPA